MGEPRTLVDRPSISFSNRTLAPLLASQSSLRPRSARYVLTGLVQCASRAATQFVATHVPRAFCQAWARVPFVVIAPSKLQHVRQKWSTSLLSSHRVHWRGPLVLAIHLPFGGKAHLHLFPR